MKTTSKKQSKKENINQESSLTFEPATIQPLKRLGKLILFPHKSDNIQEWLINKFKGFTYFKHLNQYGVLTDDYELLHRYASFSNGFIIGSQFDKWTRPIEREESEILETITAIINNPKVKIHPTYGTYLMDDNKTLVGENGYYINTSKVLGNKDIYTTMLALTLKENLNQESVLMFDKYGNSYFI